MDDEWDRARELARVKARSTGRLDPAARVRRLAGVLQRRGYPASMAFTVVREVLGEISDQEDVLDALDDLPDDSR